MNHRRKYGIKQTGSLADVAEAAQDLVCATVEDLIRSDAQVRIMETVDHYLVCDREGNCAAVEFLDGKMVCHTAGDLPVWALTNRP